MNTKSLMVASSVFLAVLGIATTFGPDEVLRALDVPQGGPLVVLVQLLGAAWLAFAITNWTAKANAIGGIYSRPLSLGNFLHFLVGGLALLRYETKAALGGPLLVVLVGYACFAVAFAYLLFGRGAARPAESR